MALSNRIHLTFDRAASMMSMMKWFAKQGVPVFPIHSVADGLCSCGDRDCDSQGKHPIASLAPKGCHSATTDLKVIRRWHRAFPDMNYGVVTKGLAVIDCDSREALDDFRGVYKPTPTFTVKTARGFHFYFWSEMLARNGARLNLDVKSGPGCYVVGPGSIHLSGAVYSLWEDEPIAQLSETIREITAHPDDKPPLGSNSPIPAGMRNTTLTKFAGYLRAAGANENAMYETLAALNRTMTDDPLPDREVQQIARSIAKKPGKVWPSLIPISEVPEEKLDWLWYPYVCRGTLGLLDGDPGDGKSQLCAWLCARITRGDRLPGGDKIKPANVFLFNFEDLKGAVIKPRLAANGADPDRVFVQSRTFQLTEELVAWMDGEIAEKQPALVILDPIQAFMSGVDGNNNIDVREFMQRLADIAQNRGCAIICVRHFGKSMQDKAMKKGLGSTDFVGISRNQFGLARRNDDVRGFIVFHMKTNFEKGRAMTFTMSEADGRKGEQPTIGFDKFVDTDADEFFSAGAIGRGPDQDDRQRAKDFLLETLADEPRPATPLKAEAKALRISASTLDRARKELGIITAKKGNIWFWSLPPE